MRHVPTVLRVLLGLAFTVFGLNYFFNFLPPQGMPPQEAMAFLGAFVSSKYLALVKVFEIGAGLLLLTNRFVPLALALLAPILVGITFFHVTLAPAGVALPLALVALELAVAWSYRHAFAPMLRARVTPAGLASREPRSVVAPAARAA